MSSGTLADDVVIVGGGEHAGVVAEAIRASARVRLIGYLDVEVRSHMHDRWGLEHLGSDDWLARNPEVRAVLGVGGIRVSSQRRDIVTRLDLPDERWSVVVHPAAWVSPTARLMPGAVVMAGAVVQTGAIVGSHAIINSGAVVEHDVVIGAFTLIGPRAVVGGACDVGEGSFIALGSCVRDHVRIGPSVLVAMGAVVTADVGPNETVMGVPAREWRK